VEQVSIRMIDSPY